MSCLAFTLGKIGEPEGAWFLDLDTSGLLVVTNDAELCDYIINPESHVPKTYLVKASELLSDEQLDQLRRGLTLLTDPPGPRPSSASAIPRGSRSSKL